MPTILKDVLVHRDSPGLTIHPSVAIPDVVGVNVNCNEEWVIGRARIWRKDDMLRAEIFLDDDLDWLVIPPRVLAGFSHETQLFASEEQETNFLIYGGVTYLAIIPEESEVINWPEEAQ